MGQQMSRLLGARPRREEMLSKHLARMTQQGAKDQR